MLTFGLWKWFRMKYIRILFILFTLILVSLFARNQVSEYFSLAELTYNDSPLTIPDYLMGMLNMPQFFMFFAFPVLFSILIADLITDDFEEGYALFILARLRNRTQYIINKLTLLLVTSFFYLFLIVLISVISWWTLGTPFNGETFHYIFISDSEVGIPTGITWIKVFSFFLLGIFSHGLLTLVITQFTGKPSLTIGLIIIMAFIYNGLYVASQNSIALLPLSQYVVGMHNEYEPFGLPIQYFNLINSYLYLIIISIVLIIILVIKFKNDDLESNEKSN
ncbi:hypothetical protein [Oceanobacillus locisalsi]|uniref:ABC transporter permease n=1 Tax=Oceanobacillus locisalsi TaxID=546107 RepID=A0ABW3NMT5_9BACI